MRETTLGQLLINAALPAELRDYNREMNKAGIHKILDTVARQHPDDYTRIVKDLSDIGRHTAYSTGGYSFGLKSLRQTQAAKNARAELQHSLSGIYSDKTLSPQQMDDKVLQTVSAFQQTLPAQVFQEAVAAKNPLAMQAVSGARGNQTNVNSLIGSDLLYEDHRGQPVPIPILRNYAMGLSPAEHFAGAFGARKGILDLKKATADAGFLCLCENTDVRMADFSIRKINDIRVGEYVLGADKQGRTFPVRVTAVFNNGVRELKDFIFRYGKSRTRVVIIRATEEHKALAVYRQVANQRQPHVRTVDTFRLGEMSAAIHRHHSLLGTTSSDPSGNTNFRFLRAESVGPGNTYDLEVDHPDHLFVLANGAIVSNSKQLSQAAHRLMITADDDAESTYDESQPRGLEVDTTDPDNEGAVLAHPTAGYARNTVLTPGILKEIASSGHDSILVRSPTVGGPVSGGVYARDAGIRERGVLPPVGDMIGLAGAQAISEPITQGQISSKHCLAGKTRVRMADFTVKEIRDIVVGDWVLGSDMVGNTFPVRVVNVFDNGERETYRTRFLKLSTTFCDPRAEVDSTLCHKLLCSTVLKSRANRGPIDTWGVLPIGNIPADYVAIAVSRESSSAAGATSPAILVKQELLGSQPTYDIEVEHPDHLFVLENGLIVSNSGGVAGASAGAIGGFPMINAMVQAPEVFPGGAVHSNVDGKVEKIEKASQGGNYITIGGVKHYAGLSTPITAKLGDTIEAGDVLTDGIPNPSIIVQHKGIGEGRKYFVSAFRDVLNRSQIKANRRNVELLARGLLNHVRVTDEVGDWAPDDVVPYQAIESGWSPRPGYQVAGAKQMAGNYLERPVLHYSIGTKLRPSVIASLERHGVKSVTAHKDPPPFEPEMMRAMVGISHDPDWQTKMLGSYQQGGVLEAARRGSTSDPGGTSYVPSLAGSEAFGKSGPFKGWDPATIGRPPADLNPKPPIRSLFD